MPFRNSKLTHLLQDSLTNQSKMQMFVNCSPAEYNVPETICSLNFAKRCRAVELGAAKKNTDSSEVLRLRKQVRQLQEDLAAAGFVTAQDDDDEEDEGSERAATAPAAAAPVPSRFNKPSQSSAAPARKRPGTTGKGP